MSSAAKKLVPERDDAPLDHGDEWETEVDHRMEEIRGGTGKRGFRKDCEKAREDPT